SFSGPGGMTSYSWTGPGGFTANTQSTGPISTGGTYNLTITNANGCSSTCSRALTVNPLPVCSLSAPNPLPACGTSGNVLTAAAGFASYSWSIVSSTAPGWAINSGSTTNSITYTTSAQVSSATFKLVVTDANGCMNMCTVTFSCLPPEMEHCTLTQGAYGNANGRFNGIRRDQLIKNLLDAGPVTLGKTTARYITFANPASGNLLATANCIISVMPAGGTPAALPAGTTLTINGSNCSALAPLLSNGKFNDVLIGQVLALSLNLRLDNSGANPHHLEAQELCNVFVTRGALPGPDNILGNDNDVIDPNDPGQTFTIPDSVTCALKNLGLPQTVGGLLELANRALAGDANLGGASIANINDAVDAINRGFDGCRFLVSCTKSPGGCLTVMNLFNPNGDDRMVAQAYRPAGFAPFADSLNPFGWLTDTRSLPGLEAVVPISSEAEPGERFVNWLLAPRRSR
ncbi:MAG: hypothetical protein ACREEM_53105, partial [Blastocatellia bacterium]